MGEETLEGQGSKRKISSSEDDLIRCGKKKIHSGRYFVAIGKNVGRRKKEPGQFIAFRNYFLKVRESNPNRESLS